MKKRAAGRTTLAQLRDVLREFPDADTSQLWVPADEALAVDDRRDLMTKSRRGWIDAFAPLGCDGTPDEHLVALEALVARAETAEDALARLREAAARMERFVGLGRDGPVMIAAGARGPWAAFCAAFRAALAATPADLAEARRRELMADGMDRAATELVEYYRERAHRSGRVDEAQLFADLSDDITTAAAEIRGGK